MKTLFPVKLVRQLIGGAALTSLALGSAVLLTACESDSSPPYSSSDQAEERYSDDQDDRQYTREDPAVRDDRMRQQDRDDQREQARETRRGMDEDLYADSPPDAALADSLVGSTVRTRIGDEEIGNIENVLVDHQGNPVAVVVNVGRFLGAGERLVAIDWSRISLADHDDHMSEGRQMRDREHTVVVDATRDELEDAPEFDPEAWERERGS